MTLKIPLEFPFKGKLCNYVALYTVYIEEACVCGSHNLIFIFSVDSLLHFQLVYISLIRRMSKEKGSEMFPSRTERKQAERGTSKHTSTHSHPPSMKPLQEVERDSGASGSPSQQVELTY